MLNFHHQRSVAYCTKKGWFLCWDFCLWFSFIGLVSQRKEKTCYRPILLTLRRKEQKVGKAKNSMTYKPMGSCSNSWYCSLLFTNCSLIYIYIYIYCSLIYIIVHLYNRLFTNLCELEESSHIPTTNSPIKTSIRNFKSNWSSLVWWKQQG